MSISEQEQRLPILAPLLNRLTSSAHQPQAEDVQVVFAAYRQEMGDFTQPLYQDWGHPALDLLQQEANNQLKVQLVRVTLQEIYLTFESADWEDTPFRQAMQLLKRVGREPLTYSSDDVRGLLQDILKLLSREGYKGHHHANATNERVFDLLLRLEPLLRQQEFFARCQKELTSLHVLAAHWGNYSPYRETYRARMMLGNLLFADNPPGLASLLRAYGRGEGPSLQEQARICLATYHQELDTYNNISLHPVTEMLLQEAYPRLKVQLIQETLQEAYAWYEPSQQMSPPFFQAVCLLDVLCTSDLPYDHEDVRAILGSLSRILLLHGEYHKFKRYYRGSDEHTLYTLFKAVTSRFTSAELLALFEKEISLLYEAVSQCGWSRPSDWENMIRLELRRALFPGSAGPLLDVLQAAPAPFESERELQMVLAAYHQDLACGTPGEIEPAALKLLKQKLTPQATIRLLSLLIQEAYNRQTMPDAFQQSHRDEQAHLLFRTLCKKTLPFSPEDIHTLLQGMITSTLFWNGNRLWRISPLLIDVFAFYFDQPEVVEACYPDLEAIRKLLEAEEQPIGDAAHDRRFRLTLQSLLLKRDYPFDSPLLPDAWALPILAELKALSAEERDHWLALLHHCVRATSVAPTAHWRQEAQDLVAALDSATFTNTLYRWISFFTHTKGERMDGNNSDILRGLLWLSIGSSDRAQAALLADVAIEGYHKMPGVGPRCPKAGDAAVISLEGMRGRDAIAQLERVRRAVKQASYQQRIGKALDAVAQREQMTRLDLEELMIPTFELEDGQLHIAVENWNAHLTVSGRGVQQCWLDPAGKPQKNLPAAMKRTAKEQLTALTRLVKDIEHLVTDQRTRLERLFLHERHWTLQDWRERYLDHPLLSVLARHLIWQVSNGSQSWQVIWYQGALVDPDTQPVALPEDAEVSLWHPLMSTNREVQRWCVWLETQRITQPFKQAHREIYPLTDAERVSGDHSRRFAGHYIRQHQLNALARARGWTFSLHSNFQGSISDDPVRLDLPHLGVRAEFEVNMEEDEYEIPRYLITSQVRFARTDTARDRWGNGMQFHPLEQIPPLVFSEVMRDIDLFVGVTSLGADPNGYNGAEEGALQDYWRLYNQDELSLSAQGRKQILERLVPVLEIGERCTFEERYLRVRGDLCTYRIHLGSGNIMMEPGDQYLCIVYDTKVREATEGQFFLPFEGDMLLALILSKALLLADDTHIKDKSILSQIHSRRRS
jgi:hypothetical protein